MPMLAAKIRLSPLQVVLAVGISSSCGPQARAPEFSATKAAATAGAADADAPLAGRSLFDQLVAVAVGDGYAFQIPFPFSELTALVSGHLATPPAVVLIPGGRSLQRNAAGAQKFAKPRVVLAATSEGRASTDGLPDLLLKDRLYIGYSEAAQQMEVVSYNDTAGRFEFQVVENYGPGLTPHVKYAARSFCGACHQNAAPIFSAAPWDETNANTAISAKIQAAVGAPTYAGTPVAVLSNVPYAIDTATKNAVYFAGYQTLWAQGCGVSPAEKNRCRRLALYLAVNYRDSGSFETTSPAYVEFDGLMAKAWSKDLKNGVDVAPSEIRNFNPLTEAAPPPSLIPVDREPLTPRPVPMEQWSYSAGDGARLIFALGDLLSDRDLALLRQALGTDLHSLGARLDAMEASSSGALAGPAFSRCALLLGLNAGAGAGAALPNCQLDFAKLPAAEVSNLGSPVAATDPDLAPFNTYCSACHSSGPYPFLAGPSAQRLKNQLGQNADEHVRRLSWESGTTQPMPPPASAQHRALANDPAARKAMISALKGWKN